MKRQLILILVAFLALTATAQKGDKSSALSEQPSAPRFGYLSCDSALLSSPQYYSAMRELITLREAYEREMKRVEDDFNAKYEAFLEGQKEFPRTILLKRQQELQNMLQHNIDFRRQCQKELEETEAKLMAEVKKVLKRSIAYVARANHLSFVLNTDSDACPFIDLTQGIDLLSDVIGTMSTFGNAKVDENEEAVDITGY